MFFFCISNKPQRIEISYFYLFKNIVVQKFKLGITSNQFNPATCLYLSQSKSWISNTICCGAFLCSKFWGEMGLFVLLILMELLIVTV